MTGTILQALRDYLAGDMDFETLERLVIQVAPDAEGELRVLADRVAVEIFYVWDGASDEALFRKRVAAIYLAQPTPSAA